MYGQEPLLANGRFHDMCWTLPHGDICIIAFEELDALLLHSFRCLKMSTDEYILRVITQS